MSEPPPIGDDPFLSDDPAAREREVRRREREAKRLEREARREEKRARNEERAAEKQARDLEREAERRAHEAARERERELELVQRDAGRLERPEPGREHSAEEPPPPFLDEPAPELEPWVQEFSPEERPARSDDGGPPRESRLRRRTPLLIVGVVILALIAWFLIALFQPFAGDPGAEKTVQIPQNSSLGKIAEILDEDGIVSSATMFEIRATLAGRRSDFFAGTYTLNEGMTYSDAMDALTDPPPPARTKSVTIPEGLTRAQMADVVSDSGTVDGSYEKASAGSKVLDPTEYGAKDPDNLEGFLFPDTYELRPKATADDLVTTQLEAFEQNFAEIDMSYAESQDLSPYEVLIIASMVEEEAAVADDRPMVARVIYNRLADGGTLNIDATIRYAQGNYDEPLLESDLATDTAYNTYTRAGLPPTPIANPGIASIEAAANPPEGDWYYFVVKPGTCSELEFSVTAEEHDAAVEAYHAARDAAGGRSPVDC